MCVYVCVCLYACTRIYLCTGVSGICTATRMSRVRETRNFSLRIDETKRNIINFVQYTYYRDSYSARISFTSHSYTHAHIRTLHISLALIYMLYIIFIITFHFFFFFLHFNRDVVQFCKRVCTGCRDLNTIRRSLVERVNALVTLLPSSTSDDSTVDEKDNNAMDVAQ